VIESPILVRTQMGGALAGTMAGTVDSKLQFPQPGSTQPEMAFNAEVII
jgi:hypothetical protein